MSWALIIGHFLIPFLALLRIDVKLTNRVMVPVFIWVLLMHYMDMYFNVMPEIHETGPSPALADLDRYSFWEARWFGFSCAICLVIR